MNDALHPAVRDIAANGWTFLAVGMAVLLVGLQGDHPGTVLLSVGVVVGVAAIVSPLRALRDARRIVAEAREDPEADAAPGLSPAVWTTAGIAAAFVALGWLFSVPIGPLAGVLIATGVAELADAGWLRRWERENDRRLLYRAAYRWDGTNGRAMGRGWFDPANFFFA